MARAAALDRALVRTSQNKRPAAQGQSLRQLLHSSQYAMRRPRWAERASTCTRKRRRACESRDADVARFTYVFRASKLGLQRTNERTGVACVVEWCTVHATTSSTSRAGRVAHRNPSRALPHSSAHCALVCSCQYAVRSCTGYSCTAAECCKYW